MFSANNIYTKIDKLDEVKTVKELLVTLKPILNDYNKPITKQQYLNFACSDTIPPGSDVYSIGQPKVTL